MSCQNQCLWDFEHLSICFCGCHKKKTRTCFYIMATVHCRPSHVWILLLTPPVRLAFWRTSHTHKKPNNGVLTKEYGYHKCSVPKNEQHINTGDMRLSQPLHVKASRVTPQSNRHPTRMETSKNANRMEPPKKTWRLAFNLLLMIRKCTLNSIFYMVVWNFCNFNQNMDFKKIMVSMWG